MQRIEQENSIEVEGGGSMVDGDPDRKVPSELKSRPKIPRTPAEGEARDHMFDESLN
jgi:hypothetical protein